MPTEEEYAKRQEYYDNRGGGDRAAFFNALDKLVEEKKKSENSLHNGRGLRLSMSNAPVSKPRRARPATKRPMRKGRVSPRRRR